MGSAWDRREQERVTIGRLADVSPSPARQPEGMFKRRSSRDDTWEGVVAGKKRSSPDGQNMYHRVVVTLSDGNIKEIRVRRVLWNELSVGDRLKRAGDEVPRKPE